MDSACFESDTDSIANKNKHMLDENQHFYSFTPNCKNNMIFDDDTHVISLDTT